MTLLRDPYSVTDDGGALFHRMDGGPSGCPACGWSGVPTFVNGVRSNRCPACQVEDEPAIVPAASRRKVGRNEPCPCESGRKFKKCCGAAA